MKRLGIWLLAILGLALGTVGDTAKIIMGVIGISLAIGTIATTTAAIGNIIIVSWVVSACINLVKGYATFKGLLGK